MKGDPLFWSDISALEQSGLPGDLERARVMRRERAEAEAAIDAGADVYLCSECGSAYLDAARGDVEDHWRTHVAQAAAAERARLAELVAGLPTRMLDDDGDGYGGVPFVDLWVLQALLDKAAPE